MLKQLVIFVLIIFFNSLFAQNSLISIDAADKDIGTQENIYKVRADYIIQNNQTKNLYLLRADALKGITIRAAKKTIKPGDTTLIVVEFIPKQTGKFNEAINLVTSADGVPFKMSLSGNIKSIKTDDKTACFYFKKPNNAGVKTTEPIVVTEPTKPRDTSNKMPDNTTNTVIDNPVIPVKTPSAVSTKNPNELDEDLYKPNNIIFLVDVSSSMKDTSKLKVMQYALHHLIEVLRPSDKVTFITYADSVKILREGLSGKDKEELNEVVDRLKAKGLTKGNKAILFSLDVALKNYISNGNNQIILATDGKFRFYPDDQKLYLSKQGNKYVKLSTMAFGNDKDALKNLKEISEIGKGNFIHIKNRSKAKEQLLEEIKQNSLIR
ncbi:MAG TPA: VWA domain-containing protein [Bacteroidia bacterium]|nr:VWA domain-containing protein [Bacteroidia bacterium]